MTYRSPQQQRQRYLTLYQLGAALVISFILVSLFDFILLQTLTTVDPETNRVNRAFESKDWYTLLRNTGFVGTWLLIAAAFFLTDKNSKRALPLILAPLLSGAAAELLKLIIVRERPVADAIIQPGGYHFRPPLSGFIDGHNLGLPSSHAAVAFGGCLMLAHFLPKIRPLLILLAIGCAYTRLITGAHFASDVFLGAILGYTIAKLLANTLPKPNQKYTL